MTVDMSWAESCLSKDISASTDDDVKLEAKKPFDFTPLKKADKTDFSGVTQIPGEFFKYKTKNVVTLFKDTKSQDEYTKYVRSNLESNSEHKVMFYGYNCETNIFGEIVLKETSDLPWKNMLFNQLSMAFFVAGAGGIATWIISLVTGIFEGVVLAPYMLLGALGVLLLGLLFYLLYRWL